MFVTVAAALVALDVVTAATVVLDSIEVVVFFTVCVVAVAVVVLTAALVLTVDDVVVDAAIVVVVVRFADELPLPQAAMPAVNTTATTRRRTLTRKHRGRAVIRRSQA